MRVGDNLPNVVADSTHGKVDLYEYLGGNWGLFFTHPADFTPVCATEIGALAKKMDNFKERKIQVIGLSTDTVESHHDWIQEIETTLNTKVFFPLISDPDREISRQLGLLDNNAFDETDRPIVCRSIVLVHPSKEIVFKMILHGSCGRSISELFRVIDTIQPQMNTTETQS
eukprot:TRINITY_DN1185_c0_g3_i1.p1 TRINITY_DN1185_c0_g3~~TRINITY_DN1185_c0_g3_i1.p1  ORF type:complete len:198 (+),score=42.09 TRINITY_DN1185_c0_g3_i1:84-596(+)